MTKSKDPDSVGLARVTATSRKRLHILYLVNDILHHAKHHLQGQDDFTRIASALQPFATELTALLASDAKPKVRRRLEELLHLWKAEAYFPKEVGAELEAIVRDGGSSADVPGSNADFGEKGNTTISKNQKEAPYVMPPMHGDSSTPWYDLPAGNLLPHIIPNSSVPIRPEYIKPLEFTPGPPDVSLVQALADFLDDVDRIDRGVALTNKHTTEDDYVSEINELGQMVWRDDNGDIVRGDTYYGWSREFCDKMKRRRKRNDNEMTRSRSRSRSYSPYGSRSRSKSPADNRTASRMRGGRGSLRSRSRSRSISRSRSPPRRNHSPDSDDDSIRPSFSALQGPDQSFVSASSSTPQLQHLQHPFNMGNHNLGYGDVRPSGPTSFTNVPPPPPLPLGPNGIPFLPPRPIGYNGPWPPPPPPPAFGFGPGGVGNPLPPLAGMPMGTNPTGAAFNQNNSHAPHHGHGRGPWQGGQ